MTDLERRYAQAERVNEARTAATVRRGPVSLIAVCLGVALAVGVVAAYDLRRLQTPQGAALAWTGAAVFGDCTAYRELSAGGLDGDACLQLREATEEARDQPGLVDLRVVEQAQAQDGSARVVVEVRREDDAERVVLPLQRDGDGWVVRRAPGACAVLYCP